jgi:FKBP-type peptidyl-prolyl cis-trans isomerase 2
MKERLSSRLFAALSILALAPSGSALAETAQTSEKENVVIEEGRTVSIEYTLKLDDGSVADTNDREVPPDQIPEEAREVGQVLYGQGPNGQPFQVRVYEVREEAIVLDLNHPLAGQALNFDIRIISVE